jgi:tRNA/rRNA methyltransferase
MLREVMRETGYNRRFPASCDENTVRRLVHRMWLGARDAQAWMGILRQMLWKLGRKTD